jgi:pimeloyl-ACP methyl ester carboxylesterase
VSRFKWAEGYHRTSKKAAGNALAASFDLNRLAEGKLVRRKEASAFLERSGLASFAWDVTWSKQAGTRPAEALARAQGYVILIHGWDGSRAIWENIPSMVCQENPRLVALAPDVNGFGASPFAMETPPINQCDHAAVINSVERWIDLLRLRSGPQAKQSLKVFTIVGHSMGGAATFYLHESAWRPNEVARLALAPALLSKDRMRKEFYKALGLGLYAGSSTNALNWLKKRLAPRLIGALIGDASKTVKNEHLRIFEGTAKGVLAQTFFAMGEIPNPVRQQRWPRFRVVLGHRDRLVGVSPMLLLLEDLGFSSQEISVVLGDHYLFSVGQQSRRLHTINREIVINQILGLHEECRQAQRESAR